MTFKTMKSVVRQTNRAQIERGLPRIAKNHVTANSEDDGTQSYLGDPSERQTRRCEEVGPGLEIGREWSSVARFGSEDSAER